MAPYPRGGDRPAPGGGALTSGRPGLDPLLAELAGLYGVQRSFVDVLRRRRRAPRASLLAVLGALGAPVSDARDVPAALRERRAARWGRMCQPVVVAWDGDPPVADIRLPATLAGGRAWWELVLEDGGTASGRLDLAAAPVRETAEVDGQRHVAWSAALPEPIPRGYHRLTVQADGRSGTALVVSAPRRAPGSSGREWGVFLPLYALWSGRSWGIGDLTDLGRLLEWVTGLGGTTVATLPLFAAFLEDPFEPSPYAPVSRLLWNEIHLDVERLPELEGCAAARSELRSVGRGLDRLRRGELVDHREVMAAKRRVLEALAGCPWEPNAFRRFLSVRPEVEDYARFRAAAELLGAWSEWPAEARDGRLRPEHVRDEAIRYHRYVQWAMERQLEDLSRSARERGAGLFLDLPLGVHPGGYDVWRERDAFALEASAGAPPDTFFRGGQDWGFPPLHPERIREQGYRYPIACLRHALRHARGLRIDHVMSFHRLYWVPRGLDADRGVYVRYRPEEWYAILALEAHRAGALVVGEDLGTVPGSVRRAMDRHGIHRSYVAQMELTGRKRGALNPVGAGAVASVNTHDLPTFAGFWSGKDIDMRERGGWLEPRAAAEERRSRGAARRALVAFLRRGGWLRSGEEPLRVLGACLACLAASESPLVVAALEDLWGEPRPQNVPGTGDGYPNWRRRARYPLEVLCGDPSVVDTLAEMDRRRSAT